MNRLVFILAASHSGSTLLSMLVGAHPDACCVGELKATSLSNPEEYRCSCRSRIKECGFWRKVSAGMKARGLDYEVTNAQTFIVESPSPYVNWLMRPLHRHKLAELGRDALLAVSPAWWRHYRRVQRRNLALLETLHEITGAKIVVDSSKVALRLKYLLRLPDTDVRVLWLVRDGRAVSLTYMDTTSFADATDPNFRGGGTGAKHATRTMSEAAREWRRSNEAAEALLRGLDRSRWLRLSYEEYCTDPLTALRKICGFVGIDPEKIVLDFKSVEHHVVGNGMRFDTSSEIRLDERWRSVLTPADLATFDRIAGDLNRKYGYT